MIVSQFNTFFKVCTNVIFEKVKFNFQYQKDNETVEVFSQYFTV